MISSLREVFTHISARRRRQFVPLLALMFLGALAELVSLGAILPFLALVSNPEVAIENPVGQTILNVFGLKSTFQIVVLATIAFALSAFAAGAVRLLLLWLSQRFVYGVAQELGVAVYRRALFQPYSFHTVNNTSETLAAINKAQLVTNQLFVPLMQAVIGGFISFFILVGLLIVDPVVALGSALGFSTIYFLVMRLTRERMRTNGRVIADAQAERVQAVNEGLGGIRDVILDRSQQVFIARFSSVEKNLREAQAMNTFVGQAPRYVVEGLGIVLIACLALLLSMREGGLLGAIPILGAMALGAQRLVPLLQQLFVGWSSYMTNGSMLDDLLQLLRLPEAPHYAARSTETLSFDRDFAFRDVSFVYPAGDRPALEHANFVIPKGSRVGIVGRTGSGKSTLMDLVLGLLTPTSGTILIDGLPLTDENLMAWQAKIAHVPQSIYLSDATIMENIAFGVPVEAINDDRVRRAAVQAGLADVIEGLPEGYATLVGERGIRLSGGQRQRIGIARALYKEASLLVFDEATSALDYETERGIVEAIDSLDGQITILVIAHRLKTLEFCNFVINPKGEHQLLRNMDSKVNRYNETNASG